MQLDILDVLRTSGKSIERPIEIAPIVLDDMEIVEPVRGVVQARNARRNIVVTGQAHTSVRLQCSRCLSEFIQPLELDLEAMAPIAYFGPQLTGREAEPDDETEADDELAAVFDAHHVDVLELVRQAVLLQAPIYPVCRADCNGLPQAAAYTGASDGRWEALQDWAAKHKAPDPADVDVKARDDGETGKNQ